MPKVPLQETTIASLGDGLAGKCIDDALAEVTRDISRRGADGKPRKVVIEITMTPDEHLSVDIDVQVTTKLPPMRTPGTRSKYSAAVGGYVFNTDCANNPDQMTLSDLEDERAS